MICDKMMILMVARRVKKLERSSGTRKIGVWNQVRSGFSGEVRRWQSAEEGKVAVELGGFGREQRFGAHRERQAESVHLLGRDQAALR